jgi:hypothetical protein
LASGDSIEAIDFLYTIIELGSFEAKEAFKIRAIIKKCVKKV